MGIDANGLHGKSGRPFKVQSPLPAEATAQDYSLFGDNGKILTPEDAVSRRRDLMLMSIRDQGHKAPLVQLIFDDLAIQIIEGRLLPGHSINSVDLAAKFHTSRTPVREALVALERQRLVIIPARKRPYIAPVTWQHVRDIYLLRAALCGLTCELILDKYETVPLQDLWQWQEALEADARNGDIEGYFWHNVGFRLLEIKLTGSEDLYRSVADLGMRTLQFRHLSLSWPEKLEHYAGDHRRLLVAYKERDLNLARSLSQSLIMNGLKTIRSSEFFENVSDAPGGE